MTDVTSSLLDRLERALPRGVAARVALARRDAAMVLDGLAGRQPPPLVRRFSKPAQQREGTSRGARLVRVKEIIRETDAATSIVFEDPAGRAFEYLPGQFFTVRSAVNGEPLRRAYSASGERAGTSTLRITVKRVEGGAMSTWLTTRASLGDTFELLGPAGSFTRSPATAPRHLVLVGGGSGITPLYAIACAALRDEPATRVTLIYGNRSLDDAIFADALGALARQHPERFELRHVVEVAREGFDGLVGRLDEETAGRALDAVAIGAAPEFMLCGPAQMRAAVRRALDARGAAPSSVREEVYTSPHAAVSAEGDRPVTLKLRGATREITVRGGETILEAAMRERVDLPSSCTVGGCGACTCKRLEGEVVMEEPNCLTAAERADGAVLTCVGRPRGRVVIEVP